MATRYHNLWDSLDDVKAYVAAWSIFKNISPKEVLKVLRHHLVEAIDSYTELIEKMEQRIEMVDGLLDDIDEELL